MPCRPQGSATIGLDDHVGFAQGVDEDHDVERREQALRSTFLTRLHSGRIDELISTSSEDELARELDLACGDLLTAEANESILVKLFTEVPAGEWLRVGLPSGLADVHVTWLHLPSEADESFRFVIFLHAESAWSMTATYNVQRLPCRVVDRPGGRARTCPGPGRP